MAKFAQGVYQVKNPATYIGKYPVTYRSSWEVTFMKFLDENTQHILGWASESISIPYRNPLNGKWSMYIPDFLVIYMDKNGQKHCEVIEIKPEKEMPTYTGKVSPRTKLTQVINAAKWQAAMVYCHKRGWKFRICTERDLFAFKRKS
jgi:hypothetical protein